MYIGPRRPHNQCAFFDRHWDVVLTVYVTWIGRGQHPGAGAGFHELGEAQVLLVQRYVVDQRYVERGIRCATQCQRIAAVGGAAVADRIPHDIKAGPQFQRVGAVEKVNSIGAGIAIACNAALNLAAVDDKVEAGADNASCTGPTGPNGSVGVVAVDAAGAAVAAGDRAEICQRVQRQRAAAGSQKHAKAAVAAVAAVCTVAVAATAAVTAVTAVDGAGIRVVEADTLGNDAVTTCATAAAAVLAVAIGPVAAGEAVAAGDLAGIACRGRNDRAVDAAGATVTTNIAIAAMVTAETAVAPRKSGAAAASTAGRPPPAFVLAGTAVAARADRRAGAARAARDRGTCHCIAALAALGLGRLGMSCEHAEAQPGQQRSHYPD